jgi:hypothetical protein
LLLLLANEFPSFTTYRPGWEVSTELVAIDIDDSLGPTIRRYPPQMLFKFSPTSNWQYDYDYVEFGMPDLKVTVGDVREPSSKFPYAPLENKVGNFTWITEYHEYIFDVQLRTIASVKGQVGAGSGGLVQTTIWTHETSMVHQWVDNFGAGGDKIGKNVAGSAFIRFSTLPWGLLDYGIAPANYTFNGYWLGVMNAKIENYDWGVATKDAKITDNGWARNVESIGSQLNMYKDDGQYATAYTEVPWDINKILDPDIKNVVIVEVPFDLMAGAYARYDAWAYLGNGAIVELKPVDYYLTYTIRMECLVTKEFEFRDPGTPPNPSPIDKPVDYVPSVDRTFWDLYGIWIIIGAVLFVILLIILTWLGLPLLFFMGGR